MRHSPRRNAFLCPFGCHSSRVVNGNRARIRYIELMDERVMICRRIRSARMVRMEGIQKTESIPGDRYSRYSASPRSSNPRKSGTEWSTGRHLPCIRSRSIWRSTSGTSYYSRTGILSYGSNGSLLRTHSCIRHDLFAG